MRLAFSTGLIAALLAPRTAAGEPPPPELMAKLAATSAGFDSVRQHATYAIETRIETLDGDGRVTGLQTMHEHVVREGATTHVVVLDATKDGKDWTAQARREEAEKQAANAGDAKHGRLDIPFLAPEQPHYSFDVVEVDPNHPTHVRIAFKPIAPDSHTVEGSAWVDRSAGQFLSAGLKVSKPGMFVDYILATLEVRATAGIGLALSRITFEGRGGILFLRKHVRGSVVFSDYQPPPAGTGGSSEILH